MTAIAPLIIISSTLCLSATAYGDSAPWVDASRYGELLIIQSDAAPPAERTAAIEFQGVWQACTGFQPGIASRPTSGCMPVYIGCSAAPSVLLGPMQLNGLGPDGFHVKSFGSSGLVIAGIQPRGTLYGVCRYLEQALGVRWLAPDVTYLPEAPDTLPAVDYRYVPPIPYRDSNYWMFTRHPEFAAKHGINGQGASVPERWGGHIGYANGFAHTFFSFIHPDEYGKTHPEYFSEINGERRVISTGTQLCLSNPDVLRIVIEKTRQILRDSPPHKRIVCITQMDWPFYCECEACKALDDREGGQSGTMIHFVNQVAEAIEPEFPDAFIDTFAYTYTRRPPKTLKARDNVIVRLCSIECDFVAPLSDPGNPLNAEFQRDIANWTRAARNIYIWDYTQNWFCFQQPHPNFHVLQPNIHFFLDHGVKGIFEQSAHSPASDFDLLKGYLIAQALWNPDMDWRAHYDEFISLYYGAAAPMIREYHDLITKKAIAADSPLTIFNELEWMDADLIPQCESIFARIFEAIDDPVLIERLRRAYLPVQYAAMVAAPRVEAVADGFMLRRPPSLSFDEYWNTLMAFGVTHVGDDPIGKLRERLRGQAPPREERVPVERIQNDRYEVWVAHSRKASIIRFYDKQLNVNAFKEHEALVHGKYALQEWDMMDPANPRIEEAIAAPYTVSERSENTLTLEAVLDNGLRIRRMMVLPPGDGPLQIDLELTNMSSQPVEPRVKLHPEFWLQGPNTPTFWVQRDNQWTEHKAITNEDHSAGMGEIIPRGITTWAVYIPGSDIAILSDVKPDQLDKLVFFYHLPMERVNLEAYPPTTPLEPGESRSISVYYRIQKGSL